MISFRFCFSVRGFLLGVGLGLLSACGKKANACHDVGIKPSTSLLPPSTPSGLGNTPSPLRAFAWQTPVYETPSTTARILGYVRAGARVETTAGPALAASGCEGAWQAVLPKGFLCIAPGSASNDPRQETLRTLDDAAPTTENVLPYLYGIVRRPGPIYGRLPTRAQAETTEPGLAERVLAWAALDGEDGASFRAELWLRPPSANPVSSARELWEKHINVDVPWFFAGGRQPPPIGGSPKRDEGLIAGAMQRHHGFAFTRTFVAEGRRYAVTPDLLLLPVDRLRAIAGSPYKGVEIPGDVAMPLALVRVEGAFAFRMVGRRLVRDRALPRRTALPLTGKQQFFDGHLYFESTDGTWVSETHASRLDPAKRMPKWGKEGGHWLDINVTKQTLVAYDGTRPVFATLVSTGEAGLGDPATTKATKRGIFRIHTKHVTATMASEEVGEAFELRDIPYVQYFDAGYALHAAYWHDDFGRPRSHGCINLAPADARRLFFWTDPPLPPGWHTVREPLRGSVVFVHP